MHSDNLHLWQHSHTFGQNLKRPGELRTFIVIAITATMMVVEIVSGILFGSMALLADGLHMASHTAALSINAFAYIYARRHARNRDFSFGTGKVNALGGFTGAVLLALFALLMAWESFGRLLQPVDIIFNQAIFVAVLGLVVNGVSVFILGVDDHHHDHDHDHDHDHEHHHTHHHDHNLKSAYLHVMADALTSVLAIIALLTAKYFGLIWMDPAMGIVGAILVAHWSIGLLRTTSGVLLDKQGPEEIRQGIKNSLEQDDDSEVADLHLWAIGPNIYSGQPKLYPTLFYALPLGTSFEIERRMTAPLSGRRTHRLVNTDTTAVTRYPASVDHFVDWPTSKPYSGNRNPHGMISENFFAYIAAAGSCGNHQRNEVLPRVSGARSRRRGPIAERSIPKLQVWLSDCFG